MPPPGDTGRRVHILFFSENFPPEVNASASRVFERARYWVEWGHQITVLTTAPNFPDGRVYDGYTNAWYRTEWMQGIRVVRVKTFVARNRGVALRTLDFLSFMLSSFVFGCFQKRPDVVVSTSPQFFAAVGAWAVAAVRRLPYVFELGDLWPASIPAVGAMRRGLALRALERVELFLYRRADAVVSLTQAFKRDLVARGIAAPKVAVIRNGVEPRRFSPRARDRALAQDLGLDGRFVIGYLGTLGMAHALENVLIAAEALRGEDRIRFLFVGDGATREALMEQARRSGLDSVVFVDRQPKSRMPAYWSLCNLALVHLGDDPVFATVIPSKIFEAMGMGIPVLLAAPPGEASDIVLDEQVGYWIPAGDPRALAAEISRILADPRQLALSAGAAHRAAVRHTRERQARAMLQVLQLVLERKGAMVEQVNGL